MKKIYKIDLDGDLGELWLDENLNILKYIHSNDGSFGDDYNFIIKYFNGKLISIWIYDKKFPTITDDERDMLYDCDCGESFYEFLIPKIKKYLGK